MRTLALLSLLAAATAAQDLTHKAAPQKKPIAIVNAEIHPVSGPVIARGTIVFENGRITAIGKDAAVPEGAATIDAGGRRVYPGFIAPYTRLGLAEVGAVRATRDTNEVGDIKPEVRAAVAVNPDSTVIPVARSNGVLIFATWPRGGLLPGRASVMRADGWTWEDMAILPAAGVVVTWPGQVPRRRWRGSEAPQPDGRAEKAVRRIREVFGRARAYHRARKANPQLPRDIRWEAMGPALRGERPVFLLANRADQIADAVHFAARHRLKAVVVGGRDAALCADLLKKHDVGVIFTGLHRYPRRGDADYDEAYRTPSLLQAAGLRWCLASGERLGNERNLPYSAARAAAYGLSREHALRSITLNAARVLGIDRDYGSLEKGKTATLFLCDGDPLEVTTRIHGAFIDGRRIDISNKQTKLATKYREKYRQLGLLE